ncbi:hypothetical protein AB0N73_12815 [Microbacterium sp. NPDC089189]|uniref:hypothetical protein n=1 Tax=Microbacterium sp. NPDC089189 TaxID=3154972 RepID=UPI003427A7B7
MTGSEVRPEQTAAHGSRIRRAVRAVRGWVDDASQPDPGRRPVTRVEIWQVLGLWAVARGVNLAFLFIWYLVSTASGWGFGAQDRPVGTFTAFLTGWDADRYGRISLIGYPPVIPVGPNGNVLENDWAFLPVFPWLERLVGDLVGSDWRAAGIGLSIVFSATATVLLFLLLREVTTPRQSRWAVVFFSFAPLSFVFVIAYAESLVLTLTFAALLLAAKRMYAWIAPIGLVAAFTRPGALAVALALGIVFLVRWWRKDVDPFSRREATGLVVAGGVTAVAGLAWSWIADIATGTPHAYVLTETAWWRPFVGSGDFVPLTPWFRFMGEYLGVFGWLLVAALMVGFALLMWSKPVRRLGVVVAAFGVSYGLYIFGVFLPQASTFRLLMPISPLLAHEKLSSRRAVRVGLLVALIVLQFFAVYGLWTRGYP